MAVDWNDPDMLRARANVVGWERNVAERQAELGNVVAALDALRELRKRFPSITPLDHAAIEVECGTLRSAQERLKMARTALAQAENAWAKYGSEVPT